MAMTEQMKQHLDDIYNKCLHCGLCLPTCPTYNLDFREESSPRGRIRLIHSVQHDQLKISENFTDEMYFCLDCQACETACPAGVRHGELVEETRNVIAEEEKEPFALRWLKRVFLKGVLSSPNRIKLFGRFLRIYQRSGLGEAVEQSGILKIFSNELHEKQKLLPTIDMEFFDESVPELISPGGDIRGRVAFLSGCIMNVAFADVHRDAVDVLLKNGFEVLIPKNQGCCGSLHAHNGEMSNAKRLARKLIETFERYEFDALIVDSAGCSAFMKEYSRIFTDEPVYADRAAKLSAKVRDVSEFLIDVGLTRKPGPLNKKITYHEACHLVHTQKVSKQPRQLIQMIPGIEFVELPEATWCCGSAGIYNVVRYDDSMKILDRKMKNVISTDAEIVVTANPGCHLQIQYGIKRYGLKMEVLHPVSLLAKSYSSR
jgi:glycolate oxidase iron-sulfur subunit